MERRDNGGIEDVRRRTYSANTLMTVLGISRSTLRYYEQIGLVVPRRDPDSNYRVYTSDDLFRVVTSVMLKNAGYTTQDSQAVIDVADDDLDFVGRLARENDRRLRWHRCLEERLDMLRLMTDPARAGEVELVLAPAFLLYRDSCETGFDHFVADVAQDALLRSMPISSFGSMLDCDFFSSEPPQACWGRMIDERYRDLVFELGQSAIEPLRLGGCPCLVANYVVRFDHMPGFDDEGLVRGRLSAELDRLGLRQADSPFVANGLPVNGRFRAQVYVPVEAQERKGRRALKRLEGAAS